MLQAGSNAGLHSADGNMADTPVRLAWDAGFSACFPLLADILTAAMKANGAARGGPTPEAGPGRQMVDLLQVDQALFSSFLIQNINKIFTKSPKKEYYQ